MTPRQSILPGLPSFSDCLGQQNSCAVVKAGYAFLTCMGKPSGPSCLHRAFRMPGESNATSWYDSRPYKRCQSPPPGMDLYCHPGSQPNLNGCCRTPLPNDQGYCPIQFPSLCLQLRVASCCVLSPHVPYLLLRLCQVFPGMCRMHLVLRAPFTP
jgi:hypothetical protein